MAINRDDKDKKSIISKSNRKNINKSLTLLDKKMDEMYKDIYISRPDNRKNLDTIIDNMDEVLDSLQGSDFRASGMTELIRRLDNDQDKNTKQFISSVNDLFNDENIVGSLFANENVHKYIAGQNYNYDLICKYLPKLQDALEIKRDNVLCSDNFSKSFLNPKSISSSKDESELFRSNVKRIEKEYEISDFLDKTYMNTSKYGEDFIYIVPYNVAYERLFKRSNMRISGGNGLSQTTMFESYTENKCLPEGFQITKEFVDYAKVTGSEINIDLLKDLPNLGEISIHFNSNNMITSSVNEVCVLKSKQELDLFKSLTEAYFGNDVLTEAESNKLNSMFDDVNKQNKKLSGKNSYSTDGLILANNLDRDPSKIDKNFLGAVVERIPREDILPVYIGKKCVGYYYFEFAEDPNRCGFCGGNHYTPMIGNGSKFEYNMSESQQEMVIRYISSKISNSIDTKFINANKDLKEEIYNILNYNDKFDATRTNHIGVTFIPAEDMVHCYFEIDEHSHRGISDLERAVTPAMLYILLYLTDILGKITRSTDKRVYYVKQNIESNVARSMMNVVQQIKKGNYGMRQIESMNNILNIVGKYNDYIIPVGQSGDAPIDFQIMNGQEINTPTEIMEKMEEAAINTIIPFEFVNSTYQTDYATRFTMSNTRFLKTIYTRQRKTEKIFSKIYTKIYNYEFGENISEIEIILPPPTYLTATNNAQLIDNITQMADKIIEAEMSNEEDDAIKNEFKRLYVRENLGTYIDYNSVERLRDLAKVNVESAKAPKTEDADENPEDMMDDEM